MLTVTYDALRVLRHVGDRLGDDVVRGRLDRRRQPLLGQLGDLDGQRRPRQQALQRRAETAFGEDRRMDAARQLAQLLEPLRELILRRGQQSRARPPDPSPASRRPSAGRAPPRRAAAARRRAGCARAAGAPRRRPRRSARATRRAARGRRRWPAAGRPGRRSRTGAARGPRAAARPTASRRPARPRALRRRSPAPPPPRGSPSAAASRPGARARPRSAPRAAGCRCAAPWRRPCRRRDRTCCRRGRLSLPSSLQPPTTVAVRSPS